MTDNPSPRRAGTTPLVTDPSTGVVVRATDEVRLAHVCLARMKADFGPCGWNLPSLKWGVMLLVNDRDFEASLLGNIVATLDADCRAADPEGEWAVRPRVSRALVRSVARVMHSFLQTPEAWRVS